MKRLSIIFFLVITSSSIMAQSGPLHVQSSENKLLHLESLDSDYAWLGWSRAGDLKISMGINQQDDFYIDRNNNGWNPSTFVISRTSGNVGINNTSPSHKLDLDAGNNATHARFIGSYSGPQGIQVERDGGDKIRLVANYSGYGGGLESESALRFSVNGNNISNPALYINASGQIGINTENMGNHFLAIEGSIGAREIKVEPSGWSDFVFDPGYNLPTLEELEHFISENNHLPEIPTEIEVLENGIYLGEMDAKLLQKIEELTLYLIEQNKKIEALETEILILQKQ